MIYGICGHANAPNTLINWNDYVRLKILYYEWEFWAVASLNPEHVHTNNTVFMSTDFFHNYLTKILCTYK